MLDEIKKLKGVHPGEVLERELKKRRIAKSRFALSVQEYPQVLGEITKGKRRMNIPLALKIERELGYEEGYLMMLQLFYDIAQEKRKQTTGETEKQEPLKPKQPDLSKIRPVLFWDIDLHKIDWQAQKAMVIKRAKEKGNEKEKTELSRFYGEDI